MYCLPTNAQNATHTDTNSLNHVAANIVHTMPYMSHEGIKYRNYAPLTLDQVEVTDYYHQTHQITYHQLIFSLATNASSPTLNATLEKRLHGSINKHFINGNDPLIPIFNLSSSVVNTLKELFFKKYPNPQGHKKVIRTVSNLPKLLNLPGVLPFPEKVLNSNNFYYGEISNHEVAMEAHVDKTIYSLLASLHPQTFAYSLNGKNFQKHAYAPAYTVCLYRGSNHGASPNNALWHMVPQPYPNLWPGAVCYPGRVIFAQALLSQN